MKVLSIFCLGGIISTNVLGFFQHMDFVKLIKSIATDFAIAVWYELAKNGRTFHINFILQHFLELSF